MAALTIGRLAKELRMSKSGLFAHFQSKEALELATVERAQSMFEDKVLRPAADDCKGIEVLWNLCDLWVKHIQSHVFGGGYFFTGAFFTCAQQSGPIPSAIVKAAEEWYAALRSGVQEAQHRFEIRQEVSSKRTAQELNGLLLGAYWALFMGDLFALDRARGEVVIKFQDLATTLIPKEAFESVRDFRKYLRKKHQ
jgi:AcrR family transcriptional regulator